MIAFSLGHVLNQSAKLQRLIERELGRSAPRALYLMRLKALRLKVQERLAIGFGGEQLVLQPVRIQSRRPDKHGR